MATGDVLGMIERRARRVELPADIRCHTFRATSTTVFLANGGKLNPGRDRADSDMTAATGGVLSGRLTLVVPGACLPKDIWCHTFRAAAFEPNRVG
jgi:hypothetical protein